MGQEVCSPCTEKIQTDVDSNSFAFAYGEDTHEPKVTHDDNLTCRAKQIEPILFDCQERLRSTGRLYKDPTMSTDSIILRSFSGSEKELKCTFERPHVFLNDPGDLSKGKSRKYKIVDCADCSQSQIIIRDEVMQPFGMLLCFLAQHPHLLSNIILTDTNSYGICVVRMNVEAKREYIYIDDYTLCAEKTPLFSQPIRGIYMWPCLLQKALFKVKGYITHRIEKNSPLQIIKSFLSYPLKTYSFDERDEVYNKKLVYSYLYNLDYDKGYIITSKLQPTHKIGLSGRKHFYLLRRVYYEGKNLFYMRNPCTNFDFRGSNRILEEQLQTILKKQTGEVSIAEGNFVMNESELLEQIESFSIIHYSKHSQEVSEQSISLTVNQEIFLQIELKSQSSVSISFVQHSYKDKELRFLPLVYTMVSLNDDSLVSDYEDPEISFGVCSASFFDGIYKTLKAGRYLVRLKKKLQDMRYLKRYDKPDKIVVTTNGKVKFDYKQQDLCDKKFKEALLEMGRVKLKERMGGNRGGLSNTGVEYEVFWLGDLAVLYFQNMSLTKKQVRVQVLFEKMLNLQCITHIIGSDYKALDPFYESTLMIFEKVILTEAASLGTFSMDTF